MSSAALKTPRQPAGYETDFYAWTQEQAKLLRDGRFSDVDIENIAEELESLGRRDKQKIASRLAILLIHLLKWQMQPDQRSNSWKATLLEQRRRIGDILRESPSLRRWPGTQLTAEYEIARLKASGETGLSLDVFSESCPYTIAQVLDPNFLPG